MVRNVGTRYYWEDWAKDIAEIVKQYQDRIASEIEKSNDAKLAFDGLVVDLRKIINPGIDAGIVIKTLSQHVVTKPIFDILFGDNGFTDKNPISQALNNFLARFRYLELLRIENDPKLKDFYQDVRDRVAGIEDIGQKD